MTLTLRSYAKINWALRVLGRRDDGMHELRTIYQTISLHDTLKFQIQDAGISLSASDPSLAVDDSNLVVRAARLLAERFGIRGGASIELIKNIPMQAGLGGGSSNAAATLLALGRLWDLHASQETLLDIAAELGSDVPFFLFGGTALGISRGEEVYPLADAPARSLVVAMGQERVSTKDAFSRLDDLLTRVRGDRKMPLAFFAPDGSFNALSALKNDFEQVILPLHPGIQRTREALRLAGADVVLLSGSGASVFGVFESSEASRAAAEQMRSAGNLCYRCESLTRSEYWATLFEN